MKPTFLSHFLTPILLFCGVATLPLQAQSYKDPTLSPEERTTDLLRRMTLEENRPNTPHSLLEYLSRARPQRNQVARIRR